MRYVTVVSKGILSLDAILWRGPEPAPGMRAETLPGGARDFHLEVRLGRAAPCGEKGEGAAGLRAALGLGSDQIFESVMVFLWHF